MTLQDTSDTAPASEHAARDTLPSKPRGAPALECTPELIAEICQLVEEGSNLEQIGKDPTNGLPSKSVLYKWRKTQGDFENEYLRAREARGDWRADKIDEILMQVESGSMEAHVGRALIDGHKWQAGHEKPQRYSPKHVIEGGDKPIQIEGDRPALLAAIVAVLQDGGSGDIGTLLTQSDAKPLIEHEVHSPVKGEHAEKPRKNNE